MRILLLDQFGSMGGAQHGLIEAAEGFAQRGWSVHALTPPGVVHDRLAPYCESVDSIACGPFEAGSKSWNDAARMLAQLPQQVSAIRNAGRFDAVYVNGPRLMPAAALAGIRPVVFHAHSVVTQNTARRILAWSIAGCKARVIASSHYSAKMSPAANSTVIYNGVRGGQAAIPSRTIGVLGRIAPEKGQSIFVDAARIVARRRPDVRFSIAGEGDAYFDQVRSQARDLPVEFPGWVDPYEFLRTLAVLVVPSQMHDTNPRVIPEAFSCRVPVVAFAAGGIPELIRDGETGHLAWERSAEALAEAILRGLDSQCTESAYREWDARFRLERFQRDLCDFFSSNFSAVSK